MPCKYDFLADKAHVLCTNTALNSALASREREALKGGKMKDLLTCLESRSIAESIPFLCAEFCKKFLHNKPSALMKLFCIYFIFIRTLTLFLFSKPLHLLRKCFRTEHKVSCLSERLDLLVNYNIDPFAPWFYSYVPESKL